MVDRAQLERILKFGVVGFSGVFVNLLISELFFRALLLGIAADTTRLIASNAAGIAVSIFTNFLLNDRWTWGDRKKRRGVRAWLSRVVKYYLAAAVGALLQVGVTAVSFELVFQRYPVELFGTKLDSTLSICAGIGAGMVINFLASHFWAFKDKE